MLPPPITRHTSAPISTTAEMSAAIAATVSLSSPNSRLPINASPDTLSSTRL